MIRLQDIYAKHKSSVLFLLILVSTIIFKGCHTEPEALSSLQIAHTDYEIRYVMPENAIPFYFNGHLIFTGNFNDTIDARWVYDTGSPTTIIDSSFYRESGFLLNDYRNSFITGAGNHRSISYCLNEPVKLSVGSDEQTGTSLLIINLRKAVGDKTADGILDLCFFGKKIYEINYENKYFLIHEQFEPDSSWMKIPFEFRDENRIVFSAWVEIEPGKKVAGEFLLDLGANGAFGIGRYSAEKANLSNAKKERDVMDVKDAGIGGASTINLLTADKCGFGPFEFENVPVFYSENTLGAFSNINHNGIVGNQIISRFDLIIDYIHKNLYFRPNNKFSNEFQNRKGMGMALIDRTISKGAFEVNGLIRNSKADSLGLMLGDLIMSLNNEPVTVKDKKRDFQRKLENRGGNSIVLEIKRDTIVYFIEID